MTDAVLDNRCSLRVEASLVKSGIGSRSGRNWGQSRTCEYVHKRRAKGNLFRITALTPIWRDRVRRSALRSCTDFHLPSARTDRLAMAPSSTRTRRSAMSITRWSWVEKMKVVPLLVHLFIRSRICVPVTRSRLAVGSSASTIAGWTASARAMATRCRCPPDSSWAGCGVCASPTTSSSTRHASAAPPWQPCREQRVLDVLAGAQHRQQVEALENEADRSRPQVGELVGVAADVLPLMKICPRSACRCSR